PNHIVNTLKKGKNIIAGYCHNRVANGYFDFGMFTERKNTVSFTKSAVQKSVNVQATQTHYQFECGPVNLDVSFIAPLLLTDLELVSRPVNYISYEVKSRDAKKYNVQVYFEA